MQSFKELPFKMLEKLHAQTYDARNGQDESNVLPKKREDITIYIKLS
jgi:hypothetical protein